MILLPVDESYFFDYFSILEIKKSISLDMYRVYLSSQITNMKCNEVFSSQEYQNLKNINQDLFNLIDECKIKFVSSVETDKLNYKRWEAKKALQENFFSNNPITEQKLGY